MVDELPSTKSHDATYVINCDYVYIYIYIYIYGPPRTNTYVDGNGTNIDSSGHFSERCSRRCRGVS